MLGIGRNFLELDLRVLVRLAEAMAQRRLRRSLCLPLYLNCHFSLVGFHTVAPESPRKRNYHHVRPRRPRRARRRPHVADGPARSRIQSRNPAEARVYRSYPTSRNPAYALVHLFKTYRSTSRSLLLAPAPIPCPMIHSRAHSPPFQIETYAIGRRGGRKCRPVGGRW